MTQFESIDQQALANMDREPIHRMKALSHTLRELHSKVLDAEKPFHSAMGQLELLDRLIRDPEWAWLRPLSTLMSDIDSVIAADQAPTEFDLAIAASHTRELLAGEGSNENRSFAERYLPLMQTSAALASVHGELKQWLKLAPSEATDEAERLHQRHLWAMRCKNRMRT